MGLKELAKQDARAREAERKARRETVFAWMKDHRNLVVTIGTAQGFLDCFPGREQFEYAWATLFPGEAVPERPSS